MMLCRAVLLLIGVGSITHAQDATFTGDRKDIRLSESLRATLTIQGEAPLRIQLPQPLLDPISDRDWKIQPVGSPSVTQLPDRREKWTQSFRLDPYTPGKGMPVIFAAVKVNGREVKPGGFEVNVITTLTEAKAEAAKPVTGIEELPPPTSDNAVSLSPWKILGAALVVIAFFVVLRRLRRSPPPALPYDWAMGMLDHLEQSDTAESVRVALMAGIVRVFIERQFGIAAPKLTTQELLTSKPWPAGVAEGLRQILDVCDRAKFAGVVPDTDECSELLRQCRDWVRKAEVTSSSAGEQPRP